MGNTTKVAYIASGFKKNGMHAGTKNIFLAFGNTSYEYCQREIYYDDFSNPLAVANAHQVISEISEKSLPKGIYFCGQQPLLRYDWIERLFKKDLNLPVGIMTNKADANSLAKIFYIVENIDFYLDLKNFACDSSIVYHNFLKLASIKTLHVTLKITDFTKQMNRLEEFTKLLSNIDKRIPVAISSDSDKEDFDKVYAFCATYLHNIRLENINCI